MLRILIVAYFARVMIRGEFRSIGWNRLDTAMLLWSICGTAVTTLAHGSLEVLVNRLGWSFDMLGIYFVGRFLIRSWSDVKFVASALAVLSLPVAILFAVEWATAYNIFSIFGGVPAETVVRAGRLRCQGAFAHPILAGTFWAAALPLIWTLRKDKNFLMRLGTIGCLFIVAACSSSTPILSVLVARDRRGAVPLAAAPDQDVGRVVRASDLATRRDESACVGPHAAGRSHGWVHRLASIPSSSTPS